MKKILCSILASSLCFTGSLPVLAGQANLGGSTFGGTYSSSGTGFFDNMSRTKVFITFRGQAFILEWFTNLRTFLVTVVKGNPLKVRRTVNIIFFIFTGNFVNFTSSLPDFKEKQSQTFDESKPRIEDAQKEVINDLISLGLDFEGGRPVRQLVTAMTLILPFGGDAKPTETIAVASVDGTKLYQAITAYNYLVEKVITTSQGQGAEAEKAKATLAKMENDVTFQAISMTLKEVRKQLEGEERK